MYTVGGFTIETVAQARAALMLATLELNEELAARAHWVLKQLENSADQ